MRTTTARPAFDRRGAGEYRIRHAQIRSIPYTHCAAGPRRSASTPLVAGPAEARVSTALDEGVRVAQGAMLAAVWRGGNVVELEQRPVPRPEPGQVLVRILACGLCATDLHML